MAGNIWKHSSEVKVFQILGLRVVVIEEIKSSINFDILVGGGPLKLMFYTYENF